jgi:hypothetical protein
MEISQLDLSERPSAHRCRVEEKSGLRQKVTHTPPLGLARMARTADLLCRVNLPTADTGDSRCGNVNSRSWIVLCWLYELFWCCYSFLWAHPKTETESSIRNVVYSNKRPDDGWRPTGLPFVLIDGPGKMLRGPDFGKHWSKQH